MEIQIDRPTTATAIVKGILDSNEVKSRFDKALNKYSTQIQIPGFRPGKAPRNIIIARVGDDIKKLITEEAIKEIVEKAVEENKFLENTLYSEEPKFDPIELNKDFVVEIYTEIPPEVKLNNYKDFTLYRPIIDVTDEEINNEIQDFLIRSTKLEDVTHAVEEDNYVEVMFSGENEDPVRVLIPLDDPEYALKFQELINANVGDKISIEKEFPESFPDRRFRGRSGKFEIEIVKIMEQNVPILGPDFFKEIGKPEDYTEQNFRKEIEDYIRIQKSRENQNLLEELAIKSIVEANPVEVPEKYLQIRIDRFISQQLGNMQIDAEHIEKLRIEIEKSIKQQIAFEFLAEKIAEVENITVDDSAVDDEIRKFSTEQKIDPNQAIERLKQNSSSIEDLKKSLMKKKVLELALSTCTIKDKEPEKQKDSKLVKPELTEPTENVAKKSEDAVKKPTLSKENGSD